MRSGVLVFLLVSLLSTSKAHEPREVEIFSKWLAEKGFEAEKLEVVEDAGGGMGKGIIAKSEIKEGELLFRIPMKWVMHEEKAKKDPELGPMLGKSDRPLPGHLVLALMLMFEDCKQGLDTSTSGTCPLRSETSNWRPYLNILPRNFSAPMFWTAEELQELKGSQISSMHQQDVREIQQSWSGLQHVIKKNREILCKECFNMDTFKWASWNINSRALTLKGVKFLIPLADLVNYEPEDRDTQRRNHQELFLQHHQVRTSTAYFLLCM
jgi:hypothetical protein